MLSYKIEDTIAKRNIKDEYIKLCRDLCVYMDKFKYNSENYIINQSTYQYNTGSYAFHLLNWATSQDNVGIYSLNYTDL